MFQSLTKFYLQSKTLPHFSVFWSFWGPSILREKAYRFQNPSCVFYLLTGDAAIRKGDRPAQSVPQQGSYQKWFTSGVPRSSTAACTDPGAAEASLPLPQAECPCSWLTNLNWAPSPCQRGGGEPFQLSFLNQPCAEASARTPQTRGEDDCGWRNGRAKEKIAGLPV